MHESLISQNLDKPVSEETAFAKLTLSLRIVGTTADGYHLIESEMVSIDLCDTLLFREGDGLEVRDETGLASEISLLKTFPTAKDNLVGKALLALDKSAHVTLIKRIPMGAGLGGGSADAAAVLRWAGCYDIDTAVRLGADVPFCLKGGHGLVRGVGEVVSELAFSERFFLLCIPPFGVSTALVYKAWDELNNGNVTRRRVDGLSNDLEVAALAAEPRLALWRDYLALLSGKRPSLAGSGSSWYVEVDKTEIDDLELSNPKQGLLTLVSTVLPMNLSLS
ncbi:MAG: 4-(cytidine 5'-diphospho)-2-C-methyl-D-erythritol kinase [Actinobacteria bacterium]|nr:4-(cytidine 5'-diphospho)-2-C-methyl-D-erythritol kinase [Actinomycetota bacterium]MCL6104573.1 4-(cytidine 5'-diphospho)-2-C-methyl-D-erythritol kinase [Actinomycetota bacterium]